MGHFTNYLKNVLGDNKKARQALRNMKSFHKASEKLLDIIYQYGKIIKLKSGQVLIQEDEFDQWIFLILKGSLSVYIKDQKFDKLNSTLVGERCILGEPRRASLKADEEVIAFGIDMAMTDVLQGNSASHDMREAYNELLMILNEQVLDRIFHLWFIHNIGAKLGTEGMEILGEQQVINSMANENFAYRPEIIAYIWWYLKEVKKINPYQFWHAKTHCLNTRKVIIYFLQNNQHEDIAKMAKGLLKWGLENNVLKKNNKANTSVVSYQDLIKPFKDCINKNLAGQPVLDKIKLVGDDLFSVAQNSSVKLSFLDSILVSNIIPFETISKLWMDFIEAALNLNQKLNNIIYQMNPYNIGAGNTNFAARVLKNTYQKEVDLQNLDLLQKDLIAPYLKFIEDSQNSEAQQSDVKDSKKTADKAVSEKIESDTNNQNTKTPKSDNNKKTHDPSNFDDLLKQLGATPGVPME